MRRFYLAFPIRETVSLELNWSHYNHLAGIENKNQQDDNPTIGLILCSEKSEAIAKYSVLADQKQLFASKYLAFLPTEEELRKELERERLMLSDNVINKD